MPKCPQCGNENLTKRGFSNSGKQRYYCAPCKISFTGNNVGRPKKEPVVLIGQNNFNKIQALADSVRIKPENLVMLLIPMLLKPTTDPPDNIQVTQVEKTAIDNLINFGYVFNNGDLPPGQLRFKRIDNFSIYAERCFVTVEISNHLLSIPHNGNPYWRIKTKCYPHEDLIEKTANIINSSLYPGKYKQLELSNNV